MYVSDTDVSLIPIFVISVVPTLNKAKYKYILNWFHSNIDDTELSWNKNSTPPKENVRRLNINGSFVLYRNFFE